MSITRIEKVQPLQAGQYWRAAEDIPEHIIYRGMQKKTLFFRGEMNFAIDLLGNKKKKRKERD